MYNINFTTTYQDLDGDTSDTQYRKELLQAFNLTEFNLEQINGKIETIYSTLCKNETMKQIMIKRSGDVLTEDEVLGFMLCFSYHYFHLMHAFLIDNITHNRVNEELLLKLDT